MNKLILIGTLGLFFFTCKNEPTKTEPSKNQQSTSTKTETQLIKVKKALEPLNINGVPNETSWQHAQWYPIDQLWLGNPFDSTDFSGRYKLTWNDEALYMLAEIVDDSLFDQHKDPLKFWWDDDCVEIFIDEDNSGGNHQYNHNAFAYHVALDGNVVDIAPDSIPTLYNNHIVSKRVTNGNTSLWEMKVFIYNDSFKDVENNTPTKLHLNKKIGFALAYCDNDGSEFRENFIGSIPVEGNDKNRGWIDANIFGTLLLVE